MSCARSTEHIMGHNEAEAEAGADCAIFSHFSVRYERVCQSGMHRNV